MESISIVFTFKLASGSSHDVTIKDIKASITEAEVVALGNKLIELRWHYKNNSFTELLQSKKITIVEEIF